MYPFFIILIPTIILLIVILVIIQKKKISFKLGENKKDDRTSWFGFGSGGIGMNRRLQNIIVYQDDKEITNFSLKYRIGGILSQNRNRNPFSEQTSIYGIENLLNFPLEGWHQLEFVYLHESKLTTLPPEIKEWTNLDTLDLFQNQLKSLPSEVGAWKKLGWLSLKNNKLTSLPPEIKEWKRLSWLNLSNNQLTTLPPEIQECKRLKELFLSGNNFSPSEKEVIKSWLPKTKIVW